jgi:hypothetical protein
VVTAIFFLLHKATTAVEEIFVGNLGFYASNLEFLATIRDRHRNISHPRTIAAFSILRPQFGGSIWAAGRQIMAGLWLHARRRGITPI